MRAGSVPDVHDATPVNQGAPVTAYQLLQLDARAPLDLISEAYWLLVTRENRRASRAGVVAGRIAELNQAYELLMDDDRRHAYQDSMLPASLERALVPVPRRRFSWFRSSPEEDPLTPALNHFQTLLVDPAADDEIIDLAYTHLVRTHASSQLSERQGEREQIELAYRTLRDPILRAEHDTAAHGHADDAPHVEAAVSESAAVVPLAVEVAVPHLGQPKSRGRRQTKRSPIHAMVKAAREVSLTPGALHVAAPEAVRPSATSTTAAQSAAEAVEELPAPAIAQRDETDAEPQAVAERAPEPAAVPQPESAPQPAHVDKPADEPVDLTGATAAAPTDDGDSGERAPESEAIPDHEVAERHRLRDLFFSRRRHGERLTAAAHASTPSHAMMESQREPAETKPHPLRRTIDETPPAGVGPAAPIAIEGRPKRALHGRKAEREQEFEAAQARLRTLREDDDTAAASDAAAAGDDDARKMQLMFIDGPQTGQRVRLDDRTLVFGSAGSGADIVLSGDEPGTVREHGRIWRHGDGFTFRQTWGGHTLVNGEPLALPLVRLDNGDEIQIGEHRLRFESA